MENAYQIFGNIFFIAQNWQTIADKELIAKAGITTKQWMLLVILSKVFEGQIPTLSEAADAYGATRQNVKRIAEDLQNKGFIMVTIDKKDKRKQRLVLTGQHKKHFEGEADLKWQENFVKKFFTGFSNTELENMRMLSDKLIENIEDMND